MDKKLASVFASIEMEGLDFTDEQKRFIVNLVGRVNRHEITWDEAIKIVKERHDADKR